MISADLRREIQALQLKAGHQVTNLLAGEYLSAFKGRGMEFDEVREYQPGDDVRSIDWNVTARMGQPYIKVFREEREMTMMLMVDVSQSLYFGTRDKSKVELAAEVAAVLAYLAIRSNDRIGLILFSDHVESFIPPSKGRSHVWNIIRSVLTHQAKGRSTDLDGALKHFLKIRPRRSLCFVISDFVADEYQKTLSQVAHHHDLVCIDIEDPRENSWDDVGLMAIKDKESGRSLVVDTGNKMIQSKLHEQSNNKQNHLSRLSRQHGFDLLKLATDQSIVDGLMAVFKQREQRRRAH